MEDFNDQNYKRISFRAWALRAKAFPGRTAIPIKLLGLDTSSVVSAYEKPGSLKIDHKIPGTDIPIKSDLDFDFTDQSPIINFVLAYI